MSISALMVICLLLVLIYMTLWFVTGKSLKRLDVADTAWGGGFVVIATACLVFNPGGRSLLIWLLVTLWGVRLAAHIWRRNAFRGPDKRYEELSAKWPRQSFWLRAYASVFVTQAVLIYLISLPIMLASGEKSRPLGWLSILAIAIWAFGFLFESTADRQLANFLRNPANKGRLLTSGLWRYSRHPNYFGELTQWWAISLFALGPGVGWIGLIGPLILTYLILFVSGIPPTEKRSMRRPGYEEYKNRTSMIIPLPPKPKKSYS